MSHLILNALLDLTDEILPSSLETIFFTPISDWELKTNLIFFDGCPFETSDGTNRTEYVDLMSFIVAGGEIQGNKYVEKASES